MRTFLLFLFLASFLCIDAQSIQKQDTTNKEEILPFRIIDDVPVYKGCRGKNKKKLKKCFNQSIAQHFVDNFNSDLPNSLGLLPGKKRLVLYFTINKEGKAVDLMADGPHPKLVEEGIRILKLLPKFGPGKVDGEPVNVKYTMPLRIDVSHYDDKKN